MGGWNDASEVIVAGSGEVYTAAVGTSLPATADASINASFVGLGYHTEEGVKLNKTLEIQEFRAWQSRHPIRRERENEDLILTFALQQWNEETVPFAFGGGTITAAGGSNYKYTPAADTDKLAEKALICDIDDGVRRCRIVVPRGTVTDGVDTEFSRSQMGVLPITFKALEPEAGGDPYYVYFNDSAAFTSGS